MSLGPIRAEDFERSSHGEENPLELIEGWPLPMTPGTFSTGSVLGQLFSLLAPLVRERGWSMSLDARHRLPQPPDTVVFPDLVPAGVRPAAHPGQAAVARGSCQARELARTLLLLLKGQEVLLSDAQIKIPSVVRLEGDAPGSIHLQWRGGLGNRFPGDGGLHSGARAWSLFTPPLLLAGGAVRVARNGASKRQGKRTSSRER